MTQTLFDFFKPITSPFALKIRFSLSEGMLFFSRSEKTFHPPRPSLTVLLFIRDDESLLVERA
jgi:hypothetical protein